MPLSEINPMEEPQQNEENSWESRLQATNAQLAMYVKDLKTLLLREERKTQQLQAYAKDLKVAYDAEQNRSRELERAYADTVVRLTLASRYKDEETETHIQRLSHYSKTLGLFSGMNADDAELLFAAAPMHDVGKVGIPDAIMWKAGPLDESEWELVKQHSAFGASLLGGSSSPLLELARKIALTHHERWDGSGYPQGLKGTDIPLAGRVVMLGDTYDALRSQRPYKSAFSHKKTCEIMLNGNDRTKPEHFDPSLLEAFREIHQEFNTIFSRIREEPSPEVNGGFGMFKDGSGACCTCYSP